MDLSFDFVVVGAGSAGAVIASRLSEDPTCRVALIEAGGAPPELELMPVACQLLQLDPATDWMFTADAGGVGRGLADGRMMVPRGKMLGGCSGMNYLAYVRGHPGDFDAWAADGATGWGYQDVLAYFIKSEGLDPGASAEVTIDVEAHGTDGPLGVSVRSPVLSGAREFVEAAVAAGIPAGDYNGKDRTRPDGVVSLFQTTTRGGQRSSTYRAFLSSEVGHRSNLQVFHTQATRVVMDDSTGTLIATGVECRDETGELRTISATKEVVLSAGAIGSPHLLLASGIGPAAELEAVGVSCRHDLPDVGKHLKDHLQVFLVFPAPDVAVSMTEVGISMGPDALREPYGPLPADPADDGNLPAELQSLRQESLARRTEWETTGRGLVSSSLYEASAWFSTGLGDPHTHDAQIGFFACGDSAEGWRNLSRIDPDVYFDDAAVRLADDAENMIILANPVQPRSEGSVDLRSSDPLAPPEIRMNYFDAPHDVAVMTAVIRRAFEVVAHWPSPHRIGGWLVPPHLAEAHGYDGAEHPSDALLEDLARHYASSVFHLASTCRIGQVVDPRLRVLGVQQLRVADASVMPNLVSGNTNAIAIMIGEKAAEMIAADNDVHLAEFVRSEP